MEKFIIKINIFCTVILFFALNNFSYSQIIHQIDLTQQILTTNTIIGDDGNNYTRISLSGLTFFNQKVTEPKLPVKFVKLIIPNDQKPTSYEVNLGTPEIVNLKYPIYPVQETDNPWDNIPKPAFVGPDNSIYNSSSPYPLEMVNLTNDGFFDGSNHIITLEIMPFQYSAVNKKLYYYPVLSVTVHTTSFSYNIITVQQRLKNDQIKINNTLERLVDNSQDISKYQVIPHLTNQRESRSNPIISFYEYVIITTATLKPYFDDFVAWKRKKGLNIGVVTTAQIFSNYSGDQISGINDDAGKIRQYLADGYSQGTMYALLAGDYNTVPIRYGNTSDDEPGQEALIPADLYFADFNGDWDVDGDMYFGEFAGDNVDYYNEIYVSRLLCNDNDAANISNWIKKVFLYEQNPGNGNYAYLTRNLIDQADDAQVDNYAGSISSSYPYYFNNTVKQEIPGALVPDPTNPTGTEIVDAINNNYYGLFSYNGHGDPKGFYVRTTNPAYNYTEFPTSRLEALSDYAANSDGALDQLTNSDYPTILHSVGCEVMPFDDYQPNGSYSYNMGESWTLLGDYGGPSMIGNTRLGSGYSINLFTNFLRSEFPTINMGTNLNSSENPADIGYNFWNGKSNYVGHGDFHYVILSTNLLGCPQTEYWRSNPVKFENISIIDNGSSITVKTNNITDCKISVSSIYPSANFQEVAENETEHTFTTSVRPLFITISKHYYNNPNDKVDYIPYQAITGGTYSNDIIVNYWNELHIPQGSYLKFANGVKIDVKGKLFVEGTSSNNVTFTSSNATPNKNDWYGINLDGVNANINMSYSNLEYSTYGIKFNNGATGKIKNSSISNNYYGIYVSSSEPVINNNSIDNNNYGIRIYNSYAPQWTVININDNNITNNSSYGLYAYNSSPNLYNNSINNNARGVALLFNSNPIFDHNSINSNTYYGLLCYGSASPSVHYSSSYNYGGYNTILANGDKGIIITGSSAPNFGAPTTSLGGYNSIYNNTNYDATDYTSNYIFACNNWWGSQSGPNTNKLYGTIRFIPFLYADPQPQYSINTQNNVVSSTVSRSNSNSKIPSKLLEAIFDQMQGHFEKSANSFRRYLSSNRSSSFNKFAAVNFTKSLFSYLEPQDSYNIIEKLLNRSSLSEIKYELLSAQVSSLMHKGNYNSALAKSQSAYDGLKLNSEGFFSNKLNEAIINVYGLNNIERGTQLLNEIVNESDKASINNQLAQEELQNISFISVLPKSNNDNAKKLNSLNSLISYQLFQNYPNPFNPTTTINYTIPQDGTVTLKIYNVLGAEVMTLVNETQAKGKYQVTFDASRLSSGIYIYKIQSGSFFNSKKMILLK